jgi:hypothetical protein
MRLKRLLALHFTRMAAHHFSLQTTTSGRPSFMRKSTELPVIFAALLLACIFALTFAASSAFGQQPEPAPSTEPAPAAPQAPAYVPKYKTDPAHSDSEFAALAYMRVVMRAEVGFNKQYGHYATTLSQLVHSGTFTQRMVNPDRGDYTVGYKSKKDSYVLTMTPKLLDPQHRSFYAEDDGRIHGEETKAADGDSPVVETHKW